MTTKRPLDEAQRAHYVRALGIDGGEEGHGTADDILVAILWELGETEIADAYEAVEPKWYA